MTYTVSITSQGQVNIPKAVRRQLGISDAQTAILTVNDKAIMIEPVKDVLALKGILKGKKSHATYEEMHKGFEEYLADQDK